MIDSVGLALYGRRSYELMLSYWPEAEKNPRTPGDPAFARKMNALPNVVLSLGGEAPADAALSTDPPSTPSAKPSTAAIWSA
jgi:hypothetical protein